MPEVQFDPAIFMTPEEAAAECSVSKRTVLRWIKAGRLPGIRLASGIVRIQRPAFDVSTGRVKPVMPPELLEPRSWEEMIAEYERYFGMSTQDMMALRAAGSTPELHTADDERMYEWWQRSTDLAVSAGLIDVTPAANGVSSATVVPTT
ncbi:MAG: helix-turn-helix domain-containing protein [Chloroflexota bacterium]